MLGDIVCNQLLVSHLVATFSLGHHRDGYGRYAVRASGSMKQNEHVFSLCLTRQIIKTVLVIETVAFGGTVHSQKNT